MATIESAVATPVVAAPCSCVAGCPQCVPGLAPVAKAPSTSKRNVALKAMRAAVPARSIVLSMVVESIGNVARRPGSKAAKCIESYKVGATLQAIIASAPAGLESYTKACLVWDVQHGNIVVK